MACNVFGTPVTAETLKGMPEYADKETITRQDLADVALFLKNAEGKDIHARSYVENLYQKYDKIHCALGLIYNATGATLRYHRSWHWYGFEASAPFPFFIENGQWGAFLCVSKEKRVGQGCGGTVVYSGPNYESNRGNAGYFIGWDTNSLPTLPQAYVEIGLEGQFNVNSQLQSKIKASGQHSTSASGGLFASAMIGCDQMCVLEVIIRPLRLPY